MKVNVNPVKGMRDFLPADVRLREYVKSTITAVYEKQGFSLIDTPALENIEMLTNSEGGDNLQLIFKVLKRGEKLQLTKPDLTEDDLADLGLRYDLTLPLTRFYASNKDKLPTPFKAMQIGTVYRAERQQKGRYRAFTQCDIDVISEAGHIAECELIHSTAKALMALEFKSFKVKISDRRILSAVILSAGFAQDNIASICTTLDKADKIGWEQVESEIVASGLEQSKVQSLLNTIRGLNIDSLEDQGVANDISGPLQEVISIVSAQAKGNYEIVFTPTLVRGMGYYTGMVFEIETEGLGLSVAGGGRYDNMIGKWIGTKVPAVGFSIGFERIILLLQERGFTPPQQGKRIAVLYNLEHDSLTQVLELAEQLRDQGYLVSTIPARNKLGKQLDQIESDGFDGYYTFAKGEISSLTRS